MQGKEIRLGCEIRKFARAINQHLEKLLAEKADELGHMQVGGLTYMQARVITYLSRNRDRAIYQRDLEQEFQIRGPSVTSLLQLMEKNGLIVRSRVSHDGRLKRLELTKRAIEIDQIIQECVARHEEALRSGLTQGETEQFFFLMQKMEQNLLGMQTDDKERMGRKL